MRVFRCDRLEHDAQDYWTWHSRRVSFTLRVKWSPVQALFSPGFICTANHAVWVLLSLQGCWTESYSFFPFPFFFFWMKTSHAFISPKYRDLGSIVELGCRKGRLGEKGRCLEGWDHIGLCWKPDSAILYIIYLQLSFSSVSRWHNFEF